MFENEQIAEDSGTTSSSTEGSTTPTTGDSTDLVEPIQPADLDGIESEPIKKYCPKCGAVLKKPSQGSGKGIYQRKEKLLHWTPEENMKVQEAKMRKLIFKFYTWFSFVKNERKNKRAAEFFLTEFPTRSPIAVYQKAWRVRRRKERTKIRKTKARIS